MTPSWQEILQPDGPEPVTPKVERAQVFRPLATPPWTATGPHPTRLRLWTPFRDGNRKWIKDVCGARTRPVREGQFWYVARPHFHELTRAAAERFGECEVIAHYNTLETCTTGCQEATGDDCECSCRGRDHGGGRAQRGWVPVGHHGLVGWNVTEAEYLVRASWHPLADQDDATR